ncbi:DUF6265 family protein [Flavobacterium cerinum]|uniref:DUF6265 family protein n=1 Tax=Flavobacterium cerinum TaxID=2502784 RepID=A0ABY5IM98_9FLAO|nr:DUF6265 family protein [Flavobacterium cerinum]UUC43915.1 DUF6265 family protein [Flavobacterium cerinum]
MKTTLCFLIAGFTFFGAGTAPQSDAIKKAEWLIGTWENKTSKGIMYETWRKINDREYLGKSYILKDKDTIVFETIQLIQDHNTLFYIPTVKDQNNNKPVHFIAKTVTETQLVFENKQHDFPQIIMYTKKSQDALTAEISGTKNGQLRKQTFPMKRIK